MELIEEAGARYSREVWRARYESRTNAFQYAHLYCILRKPERWGVGCWAMRRSTST